MCILAVTTRIATIPKEDELMPPGSRLYGIDDAGSESISPSLRGPDTTDEDADSHPLYPLVQFLRNKRQSK